MNKPILITGCGSSGTAYIAAVLQACGVDVKHERMGRDGMSSWLAAPGPSDISPPEGRWQGVRYIDFDSPPIVVHQVRHPLRAIRTFQRTRPRYWQYIYRYLPIVDPAAPLIIRCMKYWIGWNRLAERLADITYQVEEIRTHDGWSMFCQAIGRPELINLFFMVSEIPTKTNSKPKPHWFKKWTWEDLLRADRDLTAQVCHTGRRYGYYLPN